MITFGSCGIFERYDCWCRNETNLGWMRHYQYVQDNLDPMVIEEWCYEMYQGGGSECIDIHTLQYEYCAERPTSDLRNRTEFCYHNSGIRGTFEQAHNFDDGPAYRPMDDQIYFNRYLRDIKRKTPDLHISDGVAVRNLCGPICQDFQGWNLPIMKAWEPDMDHGPIQSRHQLYEIRDMPVHERGGGEFPPDPIAHPEAKPFQKWYNLPINAISKSPHTNYRWITEGMNKFRGAWTSEGMLLYWSTHEDWQKPWYDPQWPRPPWNLQLDGWDIAEPEEEDIND